MEEDNLEDITYEGFWDYYCDYLEFVELNLDQLRTRGYLDIGDCIL